MKNGGKTVICAVGCLALAIAGRGAVNPPVEGGIDARGENPYTSIITNRNVFDLHDPPPPVLETNKPTAPPANIKLTGITTIFGNKQALFIINELGAAGKLPATHSVILAEGQRAGVLEVLEINPAGRNARIKNDDVESLISIETNKVASAPPGPAGGMPGAHAPPYGAPGGQPGGFQPRGGYNPGGNAIPSRPLRSETSTPQPNYNNASVAPQSYNNYPSGYNNNSGVQTPGGLNMNTAQTGVSGPPTQQPALSPQEQWTLMEAQREQSLAGQADPNIALIMPPTPLSPPGQQPPANENTTTPPGTATPVQQAPALGSGGRGTLSGIYVPSR
jgi:hypothetical protein